MQLAINAALVKQPVPPWSRATDTMFRKVAATTCFCSTLLTQRATSEPLPLQAQADRHRSSSCELLESTQGGELLHLCEQGQVDRALDALNRMDAVPSVTVYASLLKACTKRKALAQAKRVHAHLSKYGLESTKFLGENVVTTFVKCGGLEDALHVFHRLPLRSAFSWTAIISGYCALGQGHEALRVYQLMQKDGVKPNAYTFVSLIKACGCILDLSEGKRIHCDVRKYGCESDVFVGTCLVEMYGKSGSLVDAQYVFDGLTQRDVVSWNAMITAYVQQRHAERALNLYEEMWEEGVNPTDRIFVSLFQACGMLAEMEEGEMVLGMLIKVRASSKGQVIHAVAQTKGHHLDVFVGSTLVSMYGKCGRIADAQHVFDAFSQHDLVLWNTLLAAYVEHGEAKMALQLFEQMWEEGVTPDARTFVSGLQASCMLADKDDGSVEDGRSQCVNIGKTLHAAAWRMGYSSNVFVGNTLVSIYGKCGSIVDAQNVFDELLECDVVAWNAMLGAYVGKGEAEKALQLYECMREEGVSPDDRTFVSTLLACSVLAEQEGVDEGASKVEALVKGKAMHADAWRMGYDVDIFVSNTLVSMYAKCGSITAAQTVFEGLSQRNAVSWNAMLVAYVDFGEAEKALQLYKQMEEEGVSPTNRTYASALRACGMLADKEESLDGRSPKLRSLEMGRAIHDNARTKGYSSDVIVGNSLVIMYGKCRSIVDAETVFDELSRRDVLTWTAMLAVYVEHDQAEKALQLYSQMQREGTSPDEITLVWVLQACSYIGSLSTLRRMHQCIVSGGRKLSTTLANTLITAYGRCSSMVDGQAVFDELAEADAVSWNALITGYARQGDCAVILQCYEDMKMVGMKPDGVTFLSLLSACSHAGLVDQGVKYFESMGSHHGIAPGIEHYVSMVDLFGRAGCFQRIEDLLAGMPIQPSLAMWLCLLGACRKHGKVLLGEKAFHSAVLLHPDHAAAYVLMSSIYADAGLLDKATEVKNARDMEVAWKKPGQSWIEHEDEVHSFIVGDLDHLQRSQLYDMLDEANIEMRKEGHWTDPK